MQKHPVLNRHTATTAMIRAFPDHKEPPQIGACCGLIVRKTYRGQVLWRCGGLIGPARCAARRDTEVVTHLDPEFLDDFVKIGVHNGRDWIGTPAWIGAQYS